MLNDIEIGNVLFLDIETVPQTYSYKDLKEETKELWDKKWLYNKDASSEELYSKAGIFAEFAKIICISVGYFNGSQFRIKSYYGDDEAILLKEFKYMLEKHFDHPEKVLCGHNAKEFDFPFICRRLLVNGIGLPNILNIAGKKPWEIKHLDTMELWKFGDYKSFTSLNLLAHIFNIPTPKDEIDGSQVARVYYEEKDLEKIVRYCGKDVVTVARVFQKYQGKPMIKDEMIEYL